MPALGPKAIAAHLGIAVGTLHKLKSTGKLAGLKFFKLCNCKQGGKAHCNCAYYVMEEDLAAWIEGRKEAYLGERK